MEKCQVELIRHEPLLKVERKANYRMEFRFILTPVESVGEPDERLQAKEETVEVEITEQAIRSWKLHGRSKDIHKVLFFYAIQALRDQQKAITLTTETSQERPCDPSRITFPPSDPFAIERPRKFGFGAFR